jgi:hypothetical protein
MEGLTADYESGALHPADVKLALLKSLNKILQVKLLSVHISRFPVIFLLLHIIFCHFSSLHLLMMSNILRLKDHLCYGPATPGPRHGRPGGAARGGGAPQAHHLFPPPFA